MSTTTSHFRPIPELVALETDEGGLSLLHVELLRSFQLNRTAALIWRHMEQGMTREEIVAGLQARFDIGREALRSAVDALMEELLARGLIQPEEGPSSREAGSCRASRLVATEFIASGISRWRSIEGRQRLLRCLRSRAFDWRTVAALTHDNGMHSALLLGLRSMGMLQAVPRTLRLYLEFCLDGNEERNERIREQTLELVQTLNGAGVVPLLLKGAAHLFRGMHLHPGWRTMADIDLLVPEEEFEASVRALRSCGYSAAQGRIETFSSHHHYAPLFKEEGEAPVELHKDVLNRTLHPSRLLPLEQVWRNAEKRSIGGACFSVPCPADALVHTIIHSELVEKRCFLRGTFSLKSMDDADHLLTRYAGLIDIASIAAGFERLGYLQAFDAFFHLCSRLLGTPLPRGIGSSLGSRAHYRHCLLNMRWTWCERLSKRIARSRMERAA